MDLLSSLRGMDHSGTHRRRRSSRRSIRGFPSRDCSLWSIATFDVVFGSGFLAGVTEFWHGRSGT